MKKKDFLYFLIPVFVFFTVFSVTKLYVNKDSKLAVKHIYIRTDTVSVKDFMSEYPLNEIELLEKGTGLDGIKSYEVTNLEEMMNDRGSDKEKLAEHTLKIVKEISALPPEQKIKYYYIKASYADRISGIFSYDKVGE